MNQPSQKSMYLGIDFGTSGCRATVINDQAQVVAEARQSLVPPESVNGRIEQEATIWLDGLKSLIHQLDTQLDLKAIKRLAIDGTSGTTLLTTPGGKSLTPALMYNDASSRDAVENIRKACPHPDHVTLSATSALAKAIQLSRTLTTADYHIVSQSDFISGYLCQNFEYSDEHNALKLGYDPIEQEWPKWLAEIIDLQALPQIYPPGTDVTQIDPEIASQLRLSQHCRICTGSTDANAAFIATGANHIGDAVTSLGSTLVLKVLSDKPVTDSNSGIYSHRLGDYWLAGGASNTGARILREYFDDVELENLSREIDPLIPSELDYYPLTSVGERFPEADPDKQPIMTPRPESDVEFLHGIFESLSRIEQRGYSKLQTLGAPMPRRVLSAGGGSKNPKWTSIRQRLLGIDIIQAEHTEASYGSALLALNGLQDFTRAN